jgi:hypothetical protein
MNPNADLIALAKLLISSITALCAIYIAILALKHTAKPKVDVVMLSPLHEVLVCASEVNFIFEIYNVGYWYGAAPALDIMVFCNFDPSFELSELRYGSVQELSNTHVRLGKGGQKFIRAKQIKLPSKGYAEKIHFFTTTPGRPGSYRVRITAYSSSGASAKREYSVNCA